MYTREEVARAMSTPSIAENVGFTEYVRRVREINPHTVFTKKARDHIIENLFDKEIFDDALSGIICLYIELEQGRGSTLTVLSCYNIIYSSKILTDTKDTCFDIDLLPIDTKHENILYELLILINIYK